MIGLFSLAALVHFWLKSFDRDIAIWLLKLQNWRELIFEGQKVRRFPGKRREYF